MACVYVAVIAAMAGLVRAADDERFTHRAVFTAGDGGYHTYRIPALIATARGTLLAFCEGRQSGRGDAGNIDLLLRRSFDGGRLWEPPQVLWDDGSNTCLYERGEKHAYETITLARFTKEWLRSNNAAEP